MVHVCEEIIVLGENNNVQWKEKEIFGKVCFLFGISDQVFNSLFEDIGRMLKIDQHFSCHLCCLSVWRTLFTLTKRTTTWSFPKIL